jgi:signal transduction histidine kinase
VRAAFARAAAGRDADAEAALTRVDGTPVRAVLQLVPIRVDGEVRGVYAIAEDVTARREAEAQRETALLRERVARAEAEAANRAKSDFLAVVSHELRTPLHAIVGYSHLLATGGFGDLPEGAGRAAERAGVCAEHLAHLIDDVLLLTTTELGRLPVAPSPVDVGEHLRDVLEQLRRQAEAKGLAFVIDVPAALPPVETDPERLRQLVQALVSNAIKFTSRGEVRVEARAGRRRARFLALEGTHEDAPRVSALELAVRDTGPGIPDDERERIYEAFEQIGEDSARTDSINRGTGLGLTVARQIAGLLHGTLEMESEPGRGSTFRVHLPLAWGDTAV